MKPGTEITLHYGAMVTELGGGLALFLYGMRKLTEALKTVAGDKLRTWLAGDTPASSGIESKRDATRSCAGGHPARCGPRVQRFEAFSRSHET